MIFFKRISRLFVLPALGVVFAMIMGTGCTLQREGTCGEGEIVCAMYKKEYKFTTKANSYLFEGTCEIKNEDDLSSTFSDPFLQIKVRGAWDRQERTFAETVDIKGDHNSKMAVTGLSSVDPWLNPYHPVGISAMSGDPQAFAANLCLENIPPEYSVIPFSRNVIIHVLTFADLALLHAQASSPEEYEPPPAPPCPSGWVTGPPLMDMPKPGLVYKENVKGVTVYLLSRCGVQNVEYSGSEYHVFFESTGSNGWEKFRGYKVKMSYAHQGGSLGSETLPLDGPGKWRVRARHITKQKHKGTVTIGAFSDWVEFWVGEPKTQISEIDSSAIKVLPSESMQLQEMKRDWDAAASRPILSTAGKPTLAEGKTYGKLALKTRPMAHMEYTLQPLRHKKMAALKLSNLEIDSDPLMGDFIDLLVTLQNRGDKAVDAGDVTVALECAQKPSADSCGYRIASFLVPKIDPGETWTHRLVRAIQVNNFGAYTVTATAFGSESKPSVGSVSFSAKVKAVLSPKKLGAGKPKLKTIQ